ncbi:MAG: hypothetical protein ACOC1L_03995 [Bacillota bacterium]
MPCYVYRCKECNGLMQKYNRKVEDRRNPLKCPRCGYTGKQKGPIPQPSYILFKEGLPSAEKENEMMLGLPTSDYEQEVRDTWEDRTGFEAEPW